MSCLCDKVKPIPQCTDLVIIGAIDPNIDVIVQFKDIITDRVKQVNTTSDSEGNVIADISDIQGFLTPNFIYEIRVFLADTNVQLDFIIDQVAKDCVQLQIESGEIFGVVLELIDPDVPTDAPNIIVAPIASINNEVDLYCTPGLWTNSPTDYNYQWYKWNEDDQNFQQVPDATHTFLTNPGPGLYYCEVAVLNAAGDNSENSNEITLV